MKMKRYFAADARQALRELRAEQGPDAVILSNRNVPGGVEIIAALDYEDALSNASLGNPGAMADSPVAAADERSIQRQAAPGDSQVMPNIATQESALGKIRNELKGLRNIMEAPMMQFAWGEMDRVQPLYANLLKQLMMLGLGASLSEQLAKRVAAEGLDQKSWLKSLKLLSKMMPVVDDELMTHGGIAALVGPTGVGKTTTIAKIAARFALRHGRRNVSLVTMDSYRIGAHEQLRTYGRILGVPVQVATDCEELKTILNHSSEHKLTLIDTAGISQRDLRLSEQLATLNIGEDIKIYLVLSATGQMNLQDDVVRSFGKTNLHGCILTKLDEAASLGEVFSVLIKHKLPVAYLSNGQKVPDDLHLARGNSLVKEAVKLVQRSKRSPSQNELAYAFGGKVSNASI
jgi:flagellar biosynthesis protein FlhF